MSFLTIKVVVISASCEHLVGSIAEQLVADVALAIGVEIVDERYSGKTFGTMTYKEGKITRLNSGLSETTAPRFAHTWA
ncbi:hypothetical protein LU604_09625 [Erwinia tracheiphila]|uniref:haloacid dehalogenase-like hydrolase n=1 Tax=Erwinia tracheiphila TaxID=65700 RepID=UPI001F39E180|nr:haloacid dehalogenase-like hydrolase [Erwinia tracheiphila]UIA85084.1 hypothetical protein LU604_09625 [Erwinia tracheiphila]UIA93684.1 hypothetical protein LU632_09585 [Erwinia tracheiphila]